jgi:hypothetical protein
VNAADDTRESRRCPGCQARQVWEAWPGQDQEVVRDLKIQLVPPRYFQR